MIPSILALVAASALAADPSPERLVGLLDSPDRVVRDEAARTLEEGGGVALPALLAARDAAGPGAGRDRLSVLIGRVEARALAEPTRIVLDFDDRPLGEAVGALAARSGRPIALEGPDLATRRISVRNDVPLPFWEALDRLGRAGHVRHDPGPRRDEVGNDPGAATIRLVDGDPPGPAAYPGPLRVQAFAVHRHRDLEFEAPGPFHTRPHDPEVTVEIQGFAEPGRSIHPAGSPRLVALDALGRPIAPAPGGGGGGGPGPAESSWLIPGRTSLLQWHVPLGLPDLPAGSPLRLRGMLPVVIARRQPDPITIPLADAAGKEFRRGSAVVRVAGLGAAANNQTQVDFALGDEAKLANRASAGPEADRLGDYPRDRIEFEDADGRPLAWVLPGNPFAATADGKIQVQALVAGPAPPARLRVFGLLRLATELPFELHGIPAP